MKNKFTKLMAALALLLFIAPPLVGWGQTRTEVTYDFSEIPGFDQWLSSYAQHVVEYDDATVTFTSANKNTQTITDIPVTKGQPVSLVLNNTEDYQITAVTFVCRQWGTKSQTITLNYSTDGGSTYTSTDITSTNFTITSSSLAEGTNAVEITFINANQIGIESCTYTFESVGGTPPSAPEIQILAEELALSPEENEDGEFNVTYTNDFEPFTAFAKLYNDANHTEEFDGDWIILVDEDLPDPSIIQYMVEANTSTEERTVYMYVEAMDANEVVISAVFAVTQAAPVPLYAVSFELDGGTFVPNEVFTEDIVEVEAGTYALPSATKDGYTFDGWNDGTQTYAAGANYTVSDDVEFTAQWTENSTPGGSVTDVLNWEATGSPTNYTDWTCIGTSGAEYAGQSSGTYQSIQLRSNNNNSGIVTTTSAGKVTKVTVTWNSNTQNGRTLNVYGKNTAYSAATDLYGDNAGTLLGTIVKGTSTELNITGNYAFIGLRSASSAMYLDEIDITWETSGTPVPTITVTPATAQAFTYIVGNGPSGVQLFEPTGANLTSNIITVAVTENGAFEIISDNYSEYGYMVTTGVSGYGVDVRLKAGLEAGSYTDNLTFSSEGATDVVIALTGTVTTPVVDMTIAEVRAQGTGDVVTTGTITSISGNGTKTAYIQDATAAIVVYGSFTAAVGDEIRVSGTLDDYNGLLEIKNPTVTVLSSGNTIDPELMTIAEINASTNQGWYIRVENATVTAINNKNTTIAQGENSIVVYNITGVEYAVNDVISLNGNIGYHDAIQIANPTDVVVAVSGFAYQYSINGVLGEVQYGTEITLNNGTAVGGLAFAGWTTNPNDVENILAVGATYELEADGVIFYAVYSKTVASGNYVKVIETPDDWSGNYLIVNKNYGVAFNGALQPLDVVNNTINVYAYGDNVSATFETNAGIFTIIPTVGDSVAIQSASGLYIGQNTDANGILTSTETVFNNAISFDEDKVNIVGKGGAYLRYNKASNQNRFRYYKSATYTSQEPIQLYKQEGEITSTTSFYTRVFANETATADITIIGPSIIPSGDSLTMWNSEGSYTLTNNLGADKFIIEDGAQLYYYNSVLGTMQKNIDACSFSSGSNDGYYLITTPIDAYVPSAANGFLTTNYDLYAYDATEDMEWRNYKADEFSSLAFGKGYLYANGENTTLQFAGMLYAEGMCIENLAYVENDGLKSLNLVGNPYTWSEKFCLGENGSTMWQAPETNYLSMNDAGNGFIVTTATSFTAQPLQGFFVQATAEGQLIMETGAAVEPGLDEFMAGSSNLNIQIDHNNNLVDNAIVNFGNGSMLKKFYLSNNNTRVYIPQGNQDYAVVRSANEGEMPVSFKASKNGNYTISVNAENLEMNYLHLIDNMTGADVDLLANPSYTFEAKTSDYASRFKLVFSANNSTNENANETFAFFNGSEWYISNLGEATLQVVDMTGRIVSSETVNGNATLTTDNLSAGVYVMRLVSGNDVKTQKVVIR